MIQRATAVFTEIVKGLLRFGLDRLGNTGADDPANAPSGLTVEACHPYGFRSRPRDPDADANGVPTKGAGLLLLDFGGGDEGGFPTQDPRVELVDEGKGGAQRLMVRRTSLSPPKGGKPRSWEMRCNSSNWSNQR